jgi:hypothetical protein
VKSRLQPREQQQSDEAAGSAADPPTTPLERVPAIASILGVLPRLVTAFGKTRPARSFPDFVSGYSPVVGFVCCFALLIGGSSGGFVARAAVIHLLAGLLLGALYFFFRPGAGGPDATRKRE